jgi:outer membrane protein TolC
MAALCSSLCGTSYSAEPEKVVLNIGQVLEMVTQNNRDVVSARRSVEVAEQGVRVANAAKLPDLSASANVNYLGDITIMDRHFRNATGVAMPHLNNSFEVTLYQPLYEGGAITSGVQLARQQNEMSKTQLEQTRQSVSMEAIGCYLELFKAHNLVNVYDENIATTRRLIDEMNARRKEGVVLKNDITRYELRLSTLNYDRLTIANRIAVLNHSLCLLLGMEEREIETDISDELTNMPALSSKENWHNTSINNSLRLKMLNIQQEMNANQRKLLKAERLPHFGFMAVDKLEGPITFEIPVINSNYNVWFFGLNARYNFSSLFKTSKSLTKNAFERSVINSNIDATLTNIDRTIDDTYTNYTQAFSMLQTEEKNVELATENYRVVENRYNNQLALLTDMLDASTAKLDAEVRLVNARVNIIYYYYQLKYNSGTL